MCVCPLKIIVIKKRSWCMVILQDLIQEKKEFENAVQRLWETRVYTSQLKVQSKVRMKIECFQKYYQNWSIFLPRSSFQLSIFFSKKIVLIRYRKLCRFNGKLCRPKLAIVTLASDLDLHSTPLSREKGLLVYRSMSQSDQAQHFQCNTI